MVEGARIPEELDGLYEDAFVTRDRRDLCALYDEGAVVVANGEEARGGAAIAAAVARLWSNDRTYVANTRCVLRSRELALVVAEAGLHVLRRGNDGAWRAAISLLDLQPQTRRRTT
jgi:ketosteroid isomerase-like protein